MKQRLALLVAAAILTISLVGCSSRNEPETNGTNTVTPDTTPSVLPDDNLPNNDADEGGGAGGTTDSNNGMFDNGNGSNDNQNGSTGNHNANQTDNGTNREDGVLDDVGDAAGDLMRGVGDAANDVLNGVGRAITPNR